MNFKKLKFAGLFVALNFIVAGAVAQNEDTALVHLIPDSIPSYENKPVQLYNSVIKRWQNLSGAHMIMGEKIHSLPVADVQNTLAGRLPGLEVYQTSGRAVFSKTDLVLRGQTPLLIIDGVPRNFTAFNPKDIQSITVLNDALSTYMLGLQSSSGAVLITTKDRSEKASFELNLSGQYGFLQDLFVPKFLTGGAYATLFNQAQKNSFPNSVPQYSASQIAAYNNGTNNPITAPNLNWYRQIIPSNHSGQQRYNMDVAGNSETFRYYSSIEYFRQPGSLVTSPNNAYNTNDLYKRMVARINTQTDFSPSILLGVNLFGSLENLNEPGRPSGIFSMPGASGDDLIANLYKTPPLAYPIYNANGSFYGDNQYKNNVLANAINSGYIAYNQRSVNADVFLRFKLDALTKGLWAKALLSINNQYLETVDRSKSFAVFTPNYGATDTTYTQIGTDGRITAGAGPRYVSSQFKKTFYHFLMGYDHSWAQSHLNILGTYQVDNNINSFVYLNAINKAASLTATYDYSKKYIAQIALGYGRFNWLQSGHNSAFLPALGLGWVISRESWFTNSSDTYLKLRVNLGLTAKAPTLYYPYLQGYSNEANYNFGSSSTSVPTIVENQLASSPSSEKAWKFDLGAEMAVLQHKLTLELDYYHNRYFDQLLTQGNGLNSGILGQRYPLQNLGKTQYQGIEAMAGYGNTFRKLKYFIKGNISLARSKNIFLDEPDFPYPWIGKTNQPTNAIYGYEAIGFYQTGEDVTRTANIAGAIPQAGDIKYKDLNQDGLIDIRDIKNLTGSKPLISYGLSVGFTLGAFDFNTLLQGMANRNLLLSPNSMLAFNDGFGNVLTYTTDNYWTPENSTQASLPRLTLGSNPNNIVSSSFWIRNGAYLRLKSFELGYTLHIKKSNRMGLAGLRLFASGYNLLTYSKLKEADPESLYSAFSNKRILNGGLTIRF